MKYMGGNLLKLIIYGTICGLFQSLSAVAPAEADEVLLSPSATENPEPTFESVALAEAGEVLLSPSATENPEPMFEPVIPAEADEVLLSPSATENPEPMFESVALVETDEVLLSPSATENPEPTLESVALAEAGEVLLSPSVTENPEPTFESVASAEADEVLLSPSVTENLEPTFESVAPEETNFQGDEDDEDSEIEDLLKREFRAQLGEDSEIPNALIKLFTDNLLMILHLETDAKMKFFVIDQSVRYAIRNHDLPMLARILDNEIGNPIRQKIRAKGMRTLKKSIKKYNISTLENKCYATIGRFFSNRQTLWIEYAIEMGNLEAVALFFTYHWHLTYSDDNEETNKKLNECTHFAFQRGMFDIALLIRKLFDTKYSDDGTVTNIRETLGEYPIVGKNSPEAVKGNARFASTMANTLTEDLTRRYIL
jgi:hypothetical protein